MNQTQDQKYMQRALDLAIRGKGLVSPNPMVGCVIVHNGQIVGEGWHHRYGQAHAEVNAVKSVKDQSVLSESTVYVTLEPCSHHGKTPPCADMLVRCGVKRVVIANTDPFPLVDGGGIKILKNGQVDVEIDLLKIYGEEINKRYFKAIREKTPYVILKWAETADGFIARGNYDSKWISNKYSRKYVHKWRAQEDAILVGRNTVKYDNPRLDVRCWNGKHPVRIFIDRYLKLDLNDSLHLMSGEVETLCYNTIKQSKNRRLTYVKLEEESFLKNLLLDLAKRGVQSLIVEGGNGILEGFIREKLWDEARVFLSPVRFDSGIDAPKLIGEITHHEAVDDDQLKVFRPY